MVCKNCKKQVEVDEAYACDFCSEHFCSSCAETLDGICECYGEFKRYS